MPALHGVVAFKNFTSKKYKFYKIKQSHFLLDRPYRSHVGTAKFEVLNWISVLERAKQINRCKLYSVVPYMGQHLSILKWNFPWLVSGIPSLPDIVCSPLSKLPHMKLSGAKSFIFSASKMWNALPAHLKSAPNGTTFKRGLRDHIRIEMVDRRENLHLWVALI